MFYRDSYFVISVKLDFCYSLRLIVLMVKINFNLLQILKMNSLNAKQQGKNSNQLAFYHSAYTQDLSTAE